MGRTILIILLIGFAFWAIHRFWRGLTSTTARPAEPRFEKTVRCAECGVHVSARLALERDGQHYCSPEHLPR